MCEDQEKTKDFGIWEIKKNAFKTVFSLLLTNQITDNTVHVNQ